MALTTVWLMEAGWMFFLFEMIYGLFSGEMIPLDILPPAVNQLNQFLPFKYLLYFPVSLFLGKVTAVREIIFGLGVSAAWLILFLWLYRRLRARSAKAYESYGG